MQTELTEAQQLVLDHLKQADPEGPWAELAEGQVVGSQGAHGGCTLEGFTGCQEYLEVWVPNNLLRATGVQVGLLSEE